MLDYMMREGWIVLGSMAVTTTLSLLCMEVQGKVKNGIATKIGVFFFVTTLYSLSYLLLHSTGLQKDYPTAMLFYFLVSGFANFFMWYGKIMYIREQKGKANTEEGEKK